MKNFLFTLSCFLLTAGVLSAQLKGSINGQVTDEETGEALIGVNIEIFQDAKRLSHGASTDLDGNYSIGQLDAGTYDLVFSFVGYIETHVNGVKVTAGQTLTLNHKMGAGMVLEECIVMDYKVPLVQMSHHIGGQTLTAEDIENRPTLDLSSIVLCHPRAVQTDEGRELSSRRCSPDIYIDGVRTKSDGISKLDMEESKTRKGGVPAAFGDKGELGRKKQELGEKPDPKDQPTIEPDINLNYERYAPMVENEYKEVREEPLSTFSIDVDKASYSNIRRLINSYQKPAKDAVRIEEMVNYFRYDYPQPKDDKPFSFSNTLTECPWNPDRKLLHIGMQGKDIDVLRLPPSNLVFLIDVSGSMGDANKLPLVKSSLIKLVNNLNEGDKVAIVVYAGAAGLVLPSTSATDKAAIIASLDRLSSGGSTAGGAGIQLAYNTAIENLMPDGNNRVILCTDGDFNVGSVQTGDLKSMIEEKRKSGVYLTICGFGMGNYRDEMLESISNAGNGNYFYMDDESEAHRVFTRDLRANLFTLSKDMKIQIEFNPSIVKSYRLVGYENRLLNKEDFNDDTKDAGELGAGHQVTAFYELEMTGKGMVADGRKTDPLKYQTIYVNKKARNNDLMTIKFRYKPLKKEKSELLEIVVPNHPVELKAASVDLQFAAAVASFGMLLRDSKFRKSGDLDEIIQRATIATANTKDDDKLAFLKLLETYKRILYPK